MKTVCHITSVHSRYDMRIFQKECVDLVHAGYRVSLLVCDGRGDEVRQGVRIVDAGPPVHGRIRRILTSAKRIHRVLSTMIFDAVHIHDPELLPLIPTLSRSGIATFFDAHENLPLQIHAKTYLPAFARRGISLAAARIEARYLASATHIFTITPENVQRLSAFNAHVSLLRNYPRLEEFPAPTSIPRERRAVYAGAISRARGALQMARAAVFTDGTFVFAGAISPAGLRNEIVSASEGRIDLTGHLPHDELFELYTRSLIGVVCLLPYGNYIDSFPTKLFEYMAAGMAVVASDFPLWRQIIDEARCGLCVDPTDSRAIAEAINRLSRSPDEALEMGRNGRRAVERHFAWHHEASALLGAYRVHLG